MMDEFNEEDVVQLKSGGPPMTVSSTKDGDGRKLIQCTWLETRGRGATAKRTLESAQFPSTVLIRYERPRPFVVG